MFGAFVLWTRPDGLIGSVLQSGTSQDRSDLACHYPGIKIMADSYRPSQLRWEEYISTQRLVAKGTTRPSINSSAQSSEHVPEDSDENRRIERYHNQLAAEKAAAREKRLALRKQKAAEKRSLRTRRG